MILSFLFDKMFVIDILIVVFVASARMAKRRYFWLRLVLSVVAAIALSYGTTKLVSYALPSGVVTQTLSFTLEFVCALGAPALCFKMSFWDVVFVGTSAYFVQNGAFNFDRVIRGSLTIGTATYFSHFGFLLALGVPAYFLLFRRINSDALNKLNKVQVVILTLLVLFVCVFLGIYVGAEGGESRSFRMAMLASNFSAFCYQYGILSYTVLRNEEARIEQILNQSAEQFAVSKENIEMLNVKCHDLKHQIRRFRAEGIIDDRSLSEMEHVIDEYDCNVKSGNATLDVLLTETRLLCKSKSIEFTCMVDGSRLDFMDPADVYGFFGNALDNAVEAVEKASDSEKRVISLTMRVVGNIYTIDLSNYVDGEVEIKGGLPVTTKSDKANHGYGTKSMNYLVRKYGGEMRFAQDGEIFTLNAVLPIKHAEK